MAVAGVVMWITGSSDKKAGAEPPKSIGQVMQP